IKIAQGADPWESGVLEWGKPSTLACPECHGTLMEMAEGPMLRFRCHTGHGYSLETLIAELSTKTEESLWNTIRCFEETILLSRRMAGVLSAHGHVQSSGPLLARASAAQAGADMLRKVLGVYGPAELVP
ncbi:MAG: CheB methylesterase, partial [Verrucomicrobiaceae bacterium]|nr:CheB methylesterase [Verrucomicrobiaceae bacterium]